MRENHALFLSLPAKGNRTPLAGKQFYGWTTQTSPVFPPISSMLIIAIKIDDSWHIHEKLPITKEQMRTFWNCWNVPWRIRRRYVVDTRQEAWGSSVAMPGFHSHGTRSRRDLDEICLVQRLKLLMEITVQSRRDVQQQAEDPFTCTASLTRHNLYDASRHIIFWYWFPLVTL